MCFYGMERGILHGVLLWELDFLFSNWYGV